MSEQSKKHHEQREKKEQERSKEHHNKEAEQHASSQKKSHHEPRGCLLTGAIILIIIANLILAAGIHSMKGSLAPDAPMFLIWLTWLSALGSVLGGVLMWFWKKLGLYLYIITTIAIIIFSFIIFADAGVAVWGMLLGGLLPIFIVLYIVKPHMQQFD